MRRRRTTTTTTRKRRSTKAKEHNAFFQNPKVRLGVHSSAKKRAEGRQRKKYSPIEIPTEETTAQICQETATGRRRKPKPKPRARARERERREGTDTQEREREGGNGENDTLRVSPGAVSRWHEELWAGGPSNRRGGGNRGLSHLVDNRLSSL
jgi:hypothetical protein